jgi:hypothetical protein
VSSTLQELARSAGRCGLRDQLRLVPVMFELGEWQDT